MDTKRLNTWVEISQSAYISNLNFFKKIILPKTKLSAVIKANAYGHGMLEIAGIAAGSGVNFFCVHSLEEAKMLRARGFSQDIFVMGPVPLALLEEAVNLDLELALYNIETLEVLDKAAVKSKKTVNIHLKLETGANRQGINGDKLDEILTVLKSARAVKLEAVYSHFANIEDAGASNNYAAGQLSKFRETVNKITRSGFTDFKKHIAATAAILLFPESHFDMVRLGIGQYGLWPSEKAGISNSLFPVMSWKTRVSQVKMVPKGAFIGYGCTYQAKKDMVIAVLPVGYSDGYDRRLGNKGHVLVHGRRAAVVGRVCMNLIMVDITGVEDTKLEDEVVLLGKQGKEEISADYLAGLISTINYEIVTRINWQIPRVVV